MSIKPVPLIFKEISEQKTHLQNELIETERLILLWERKTQLARETIAAVDSEVV